MGQQFKERKPVSHVKNISKTQKHRKKESKRIIGVEGWRVGEIGIKTDRRREKGERGRQGYRVALII